MSFTLGGNVVIRNGFELDFCFVECIKSLFPVCDTVLVCDGESTDGTQEFIRNWMRTEPKLSLCVYPWADCHNEPDWFFKWIQYSRMHVQADYHFQMDADEVLYEGSIGEINRLKQISQPGQFSVIMRRHNFWRDHRHLIPYGHCLAHDVVRIAPVNMPLASDGYHPEGEQAASIARPSEVQLFHYGFIRKREQFFAKERLLQERFFGAYDPRLEAAEKHDGNWMTMPGLCGWENDLLPYNGPHPEIIKPWLAERGMIA